MNISKVIKNLPPLLRRHAFIQLLLRLSPESSVQLIQFNDSAKAWVDLNDAESRQYLITGSFEPEFFSIATPFLVRGGVFFDVGANFGLCTFGLAAQLKQAKIDYHLFEANEEICAILSRSALLHPGVAITINCCCVSNRPGTSRLNIVSGHFGQSFISSQGDQTITNLTIDDYIKANTIERVSFMKMDIEGHEPLALQGGSESLKQGIFDTVYLEVSTVNLARNNFRPVDCFDPLLNAGFKLFYCKPADFESPEVQALPQIVSINGCPLKLAPLIEFPEQHQTDILALHHKSGYLVNA